MDDFPRRLGLAVLAELDADNLADLRRALGADAARPAAAAELDEQLAAVQDLLTEPGGTGRDVIRLAVRLCESTSTTFPEAVLMAAYVLRPPQT